MKMSGEYVISAPRQAVWDALNDPQALKESIPGAEEVTKTADDQFEASVQAKVGPVKARFKGKIQLTDIDPPNGYRISGEGSGGAAGFAKGGATVALSDAEGGGTRLAYDVDAAVGGKLAQIGQRLIQGTAKKMAEEFFSNFAARFDQPAEEPPATDTIAAAGTDAMAPTDTPVVPDTAEPEKLFGMSRNVALLVIAAVALALILLSQTG